MMILRFLRFSGRGLSLIKVAGVFYMETQNCLKFKMAPRDSILLPCCTWTTAYR